MNDAAAASAGSGAEDFKYDLFISYSTDPDYRLVRDLESFLESFHRLKTPAQLPLRELEVCIDGSDFSLAKLRDRAQSDADAVGTLITDYLAQSRQLLVLCSHGARESPWVDLEVRWFLEHRGADNVLIAVTDGADPAAEREATFPPAVIGAGLDRKPWYDFRQYKGKLAEAWSKVRQFDDERIRLAADLNGMSAGDVQPLWYREQARTRRRRIVMATAALATIVIASTLALYQRNVARREEALKLISDTYEQIYRDPSAALLKAYAATELLPGTESQNALNAAYKVAVLHHYNRREIAQITGSGPSYLAGRWKQGDMFSETSPDGRYRLVVTERGADGASPPGDVYLLNNESLRMTKLEPCSRDKYRVEDVAFDQASRNVFVTRYFNLHVYSLSGQCIAKYELSCCTKSPVHLVEGYLADRYVLAAETKGGLWLVDPLDKDFSHRIQLQREFHGDAAVQAGISEDRRTAAIVFDSGRVAVVSINGSDKPVLREVVKNKALFAAFHPHRADRFVTGSEDGSVQHWLISGDRIVETARHTLPGVAVDWIAFSGDGKRMLVVGDNEILYVMESDSGKLLAAVHPTQDIDWASARAVPIQREDLSVSSEVPLATIAYPDPSLNVARTIESGEHTWIVVEKPGDAAATFTTYVVKGDHAVTYKGLGIAVESIERHGDLLWLRSKSGSLVVRIDGDDLLFYPGKSVAVDSIVERSGKYFLATNQGLYVVDGRRTSRLTREGAGIYGQYLLGDQLWIATKQGAYIVEDGRLIRVTEPFLAVRGIKQVGESVWLLTKPDEAFANPGPAYKVEHYQSRPFPNRKAHVTNVVMAGGRVWLLGQPGLHVVDGGRTVEVGTIAEAVVDVREVGDHVVATTKTTGWPIAIEGPTYDIDLRTLQASKQAEPRRTDAPVDASARTP